MRIPSPVSLVLCLDFFGAAVIRNVSITSRNFGHKYASCCLLTDPQNGAKANDPVQDDYVVGPQLGPVGVGLVERG